MAHDPTRPAPTSTAQVAARPDPLRPPCGDPTTLADGSAPGAGAGTAATAPVLGPDCWFLSGPTAAGKSDLAVELARELGAEVLSVDSMAVYRGLDVGTAKPTPDQRRAVPHHLLDLVAPAEPFSVAAWLAAAAATVADVRGRGRRVLFVGGTPLYLRALRDGLAALPPADPGARAALVAEAARVGPAALHDRLAQIDPAAAARIHPRDLKRIIRGLEVAQATGRPLSAAFAPSAHPVFESQLLVVDLPRRLLRERIDRRVERMFAGGIGPTARQAAGYAEAIDLLAGRIDRAEAIRRTQARTRQLAKRQLTWLRSFPRAIWLAV